jgi:type III secretion protein J
LPRNDPLREEVKPASASVFIKHDASVPVEKLLPQIKTFVTNSIEGLTYDKVSVVFIAADKSYAAKYDGTEHQASLAGGLDPELYLYGAAGLLGCMTIALLYLLVSRRRSVSEGFDLSLKRETGERPSE